MFVCDSPYINKHILIQEETKIYHRMSSKGSHKLRERWEKACIQTTSRLLSQMHCLHQNIRNTISYLLF